MQAIINISEDLFRYLFNNSTYSNNFTHEGLGLLYEYLESLEEEGKPETLNIPELCMEYSEEALKDFCFRHDLPATRGRSKKQIKDWIVNYFNQSSYTLIRFTDETVLY